MATLTDPRALVLSLFQSMAAHDWAAMAACLTDDVVRIGPYGDVYEGRDAYVEFISELLPTLPDYSMRVSRLTWDASTSVAVTELTETVGTADGPLVTAEAIVCEIDGGSGLIRRIEVFIQRAAP